MAALKGLVAIQWRGDLTFAEKQLSSIPPENDRGGAMTWGRSWILALQRKFSDALEVLDRFHGGTMLTPTTAPCPKAYVAGMIYLFQGDKVKGRTELEHARLVSEKLLSQAPDDPARHAQHGRILAALGRKEEAIEEGKRAVELLPESQDALDGPPVTAVLAEIYAWTGESDEAFRLLDHLLVVPSGLTIPLIKIDPAWDPLRNDPRFQALIDKYDTKK